MTKAAFVGITRSPDCALWASAAPVQDNTAATARIQPTKFMSQAHGATARLFNENHIAAGMSTEQHSSSVFWVASRVSPLLVCALPQSALSKKACVNPHDSSLGI